jgi:hypothetical protein
METAQVGVRFGGGVRIPGWMTNRLPPAEAAGHDTYGELVVAESATGIAADGVRGIPGRLSILAANRRRAHSEPGPGKIDILWNRPRFGCRQRTLINKMSCDWRSVRQTNLTGPSTKH